MIATSFRFLSSHLVPVLVVLAIVNAVLPAAIVSIGGDGILNALLDGFGQSYIIWLCIIIALWLWRNAMPVSERMTWFVLICASFLSFMLIVPLATTAWIIASAAAILWRFALPHDKFSRAAAVLMIAISIREPASRLFLTLCSSEILSFDAHVAALFLRFSDSNFNVIGNLIAQENGHSLLILTGCSAFGNLSLYVLLWVAITLMLHQAFMRNDLIRVALLLMIIIGINSLRLALMALSPDLYEVLHSGMGATAHETLTLLLTLTCVRWRSCDENDNSDTDGSIARTRHSPCDASV